MQTVTMPTVMRENVLVEPDCVRILDRRVFPFETSFVTCRTVEDVAVAIEQMVTQSGGPFYAASAAMVLAAREAQALAGSDARLDLMRRAGARLVATRATNDHIANVVAVLLADAEAHAGADDFLVRFEAAVERVWRERRAAASRLGAHGARVIADGDTVLTHCWAESTIIETAAAAKRDGKQVSFICSETRPYLQGARLTAHSLAEMGFDVTVITDNMGAWAMARGKVARLMTAADRVTMSGHVVNKVGTLQLAISAHHFGLPYFAMVQAPDAKALSDADVPMEDRNPEESLHCLGHRTASPLAKGWYPAFDVTPPHLVSGVVTSNGVFPAAALFLHFDQTGS
ncbi:S-methyl-5-thioribose-1-phosphate isomerase [Arvimicrobium flavum]|uniref:S-methyl-5-thioribose-1-phosphate isomerase n=1 Tax=Arvimicrobium flavum TaxID=3393320 RepID=UPI00237B5D56|nr:S-methyl-5-thioribose-1-phosphate isomerase [Mesorhizobium shangrilense]